MTSIGETKRLRSGGREFAADLAGGGSVLAGGLPGEGSGASMQDAPGVQQ